MISPEMAEFIGDDRALAELFERFGNVGCFDDMSDEQLTALEHQLLLGNDERVDNMALDDFGTSKVTVKKAELLEAIEANRSTHRETFLKAQVGYREAVIAELDQMLKEARDGKQIRRGISLVEPQDHTTEYDLVIRMLKMSTADEVTITATQFSQFVQDEWGWKAAFVGSTQRYTGG